jgi:hypothetical protein
VDGSELARDIFTFAELVGAAMCSASHDGKIQPDQDIAVEQVVGGNGGKGSFQFSCRTYLAESTD